MQNTLIFGKSESGKTTGYMFNQVKKALEKEENLVIIDRKKEYYQTFGKELNNKGYRTLIINLNEPEKSNGFNILELPYELYQNNKKDLSLRMLNSIYKELLSTKDYQGDSFWINSAANYLVGLTILLFSKGTKEEINLGSIYVLMMEYEKKSFDKLKDYLESLSVTNSLYSYLSGTVLAPIDTRGGIMATIKERLCLYIGSESILNLICTEDISLTDLDIPYAIFVFDNEDYCGLTNAIIDEMGLYLTNYNLIIDNADTLNKIVRLDSILENSKIANTNTFYISRAYHSIEKKYGEDIITKFNIIIDTAKETLSSNQVGNYNLLPEIPPRKNKYINPNNINL